MFGKFKEKLKSALSIFSRKAEEEAEVKEIVVEKEVPVQEEKKITKEKKVKEISKKAEPVKKVVEEKKKAEKKKEDKKEVKVKEERNETKKGSDTKTILAKQKEYFEKAAKQKHIEEVKSKEVLKKERIEEEIISVKDEEAEVTEGLKEEVKEEKKGFFAKLFKREEKEAKEEEKKEDEKVESKIKIQEAVKEELEEESPEEKQEESKGFFGKIKETLTTKTISAAKFEDFFWDLELALLENNVSVEVIEKIKEDLKQELVDKPLPRDVPKKIYATLNRTLREILSCEQIDLLKRINTKKNKPYVIAFFGINGTGKTTSIAKLTYYFQQQGLSVVLAACDTFRAAAIQQLGEHATKLGVKMIQHDYGSDAAAVAFDAVKYAEKNKIDVVLIDTAGRLHSNTNLMAELEKIIRVVKPDMKIFVGESITGNDCIEQARTFNQLVEMDGVILTKVDVDEKGGAPVSIAYTIKKPILFLGVGQEYKDLEKFEAEVILGRLGL